jgi:hypothetical protein
MSRGTRIYAVRLSPDLMDRVELQIASRNIWTKETEWTLSDFIRVALEEKLAKMARCRRVRPRRAKVLAQPQEPI